MDKWKSIESAPYGGEYILAWDGLTQRVVCRETDEYGTRGFAWFWGGDYTEWFFPTHWMPLPEPPDND